MLRLRTLPLAVIVAATAGLCAAPPALADSLVFIKDGDVWLAAPDGTNAYQVTRDGTGDQPYRSPSQADDGTIAASHGTSIVRMRQNGDVLNTMDPPPLVNSVSQPVDGPPLDVAISPDGTKIVYSLVGYSCPIGAECQARAVTAVTPADRLAPQGNTYTSQSSWVTNTRLLTFAGYLHQVNTLDVGAVEDVHWFDDQDLVGQGTGSTDQGDGEVNRQGTFVATIRGYGADKTVMWLKVDGDVGTGSRAAGTLGVPSTSDGCLTDKVADLAGPTWSPSGTALAWREAGGIHVWPDTGDCTLGTKLVIPGGSEPDWGPAAVAPGPRTGTPAPNPPAPTPPNPGPPVPGTPTPATTARLVLLDRVTLGTALRRGFRVKVTRARPGARVLVAKRHGKLVARGAGKVSRGGVGTIRLTFTKAARSSLRRTRSVTLVVGGGGIPTTTLKLKR